MDHLEQQLYSIELPEEKDFTHQYRLRRSLLNSSYFGDSRWSVFIDRFRFSMTSKRVVATVTIGLVITVGSVTNYSMKASTLADTDTASLANGSEFTSGLLSGSGSSLCSGDADTSKSEIFPQNSQDNRVQAVSVAPDEKSVGEENQPQVMMMNLNEMTKLLQSVYSNRQGKLMIELEDGMYVFSFDDMSDTTGDNTFGITSFTP